MSTKEPLQLKEVRTKAAQGNPLSAIQLVFQNGIESPLFDAKGPGANEISTVRVLDKQMNCVSAQVEAMYISKIQFEYNDGEAKIVFDKNYGYGSQDVRSIPENHSIVGIYGTYYDNAFMSRLGFIVMQN